MLRKRDRRSSQQRRKRRVRKKIFGTPERPRLSVYRSNRHVYAQVIDDQSGRTVASASTVCAELRQMKSYPGAADAAAQVGALLARRAVEAKVSKVVFDRNWYKYHGRIKALAEAARAGGLEF